jgi:hypothetical protein
MILSQRSLITSHIRYDTAQREKMKEVLLIHTFKTISKHIKITIKNHKEDSK